MYIIIRVIIFSKKSIFIIEMPGSKYESKEINNKHQNKCFKKKSRFSSIKLGVNDMSNCNL